MLTKLRCILISKSYWLSLLVIALVLESSALFYQYALDYYPCVLCVHVRIIVVGIIIISLLALRFYANTKLVFTFHLLNTTLLAAMLERSYQLLGVERGFVSGECSMNSGLPAWFAVDEWFPWLFKIWEPCGYTPVLLFGISMAEALIVLSAILFLVSSIVTLYFIKTRSKA